MSRNRSIGEVMEAAFGDRMSQLAAVIPGAVTVWNSTEETATIQPLILERSGSPRPNVPGCAVVFPGAYWDIQIGEIGVLLVCDEDYKTWWRTGIPSAPATRQSHRIGNSVFLPGLRAKTSVRVPPTNATVLDKPAALGTVRLGDPNATKAALHEDLLTQLDTIATDLGAWASAIDALGGPTAPPLLSDLLASLTALGVGIAAGDYQSPSVKVED